MNEMRAKLRVRFAVNEDGGSAVGHQVYGRHVASGQLVSGAYKSEFGESDEIKKVMSRIEVTATGAAPWHCIF